MTKSGHALFNFLAIKPKGAVFVLTDNIKIIHLAKLFSNKVTTVLKEIKGNIPIELIWEVIEKNKSDFFKDSDQIVAIYVSKYVKTKSTVLLFSKKTLF